MLPKDSPGSYTVGALMALTGIGAFIVLATSPLRSSPRRSIRRTLAKVPWQPVECVVLTGAPSDTDKRIVVALDSGGRPAGSFVVDSGGAHGWLQATDRGWFCLAAKPDAGPLALASPDRRGLALLKVRSGLGSKRLHQWAWQQMAPPLSPPPPPLPSSFVPLAAAGGPDSPAFPA